MTDECVTPYFARVCPLVCNCFPTYPSPPLPPLPLITEPFKFFFFFPILFVSFRLLTHITKKKQSNIKIETKTNEQFTEGWWNKKMKRIRRDVVAAVVVHSLIHIIHIRMDSFIRADWWLHSRWPCPNDETNNRKAKNIWDEIDFYDFLLSLVQGRRGRRRRRRRRRRDETLFALLSECWVPIVKIAIVNTIAIVCLNGEAVIKVK